MGAVLAATAVYGRANAIPLRDFTGDPISVLGGRLSDGYLSTIGVLLSWASAVASALTAAVLWRKDRGAAAPFLYLAVFLGVFALDDVYQLHDEVAPRLHMNDVLQIGYVAAVLAFVWFYRDFVRTSDRALATIALGLLATSLVLDTAELGWHFVEDSFKLMGIAVGALYVLRECYARLAFDDRG